MIVVNIECEMHEHVGYIETKRSSSLSTFGTEINKIPTKEQDDKKLILQSSTTSIIWIFHEQ